MNDNDGVKNENKPEDEVKVVFTDENIDSAVEDSFFDADNKKRGPRDFFSVPASGEDGEAEGEPDNPEDDSSDFEEFMALIRKRKSGKTESSERSLILFWVFSINMLQAFVPSRTSLRLCSWAADPSVLPGQELL